MAPPKNRNTAARSAEKAAAKASRNLIPFSVPVTPPSAPPTVLRNPKKHLTLDLNFSPATGVLTAITNAAVRTAIGDQTGVDPGKVYFIVDYVHVWGTIDVTAPAQVSLSDPRSGTVTTGDGTAIIRPRAGLMWPKNAQIVVTPASTASVAVANILDYVAPAEITVRLGLLYWATSEAA